MAKKSSAGGVGKTLREVESFLARAGASLKKLDGPGKKPSKKKAPKKSKPRPATGIGSIKKEIREDLTEMERRIDAAVDKAGESIVRELDAIKAAKK